MQVTSEELKSIVDACMKDICSLDSRIGLLERGSPQQLVLYAYKTALWTSISRIWPIAARLRIEEVRDGQRPE